MPDQNSELNGQILKAIYYCVNHLQTHEPLDDFQATILRDLALIGSYLHEHMQESISEEEVKDNVVEFKRKEDEDSEGGV